MNQVQRAFNGLGQLTTEWQAHSGAVNTSTTPKVQYAYTEMAGGANHSRITSMTYPNGKVLTYNYSTGLNDGISRLSSLSDSSGSLETYDYLGLSTVVRRGHSQPGWTSPTSSRRANRTATRGTNTSGWIASAGWSISAGSWLRRAWLGIASSTATTGTRTGSTATIW